MMELTKLENIFKEKTLITFALVNEDGSVREETYSVFHWSVLGYMTEGMLNAGATLFTSLLAAEEDTDNPVPVVTRQLRLLGVYSDDLTVGGKPLNLSDGKGLSDEEAAQIPLPIQQKIATDIFAPVARIMTRRAGSNVQPDEESEASGSTEADSATDHTEAGTGSETGG
jgi:hypothetical protein